ncbi:unnamed protein product, partial [Rotaria magnacalcarata]
MPPQPLPMPSVRINPDRAVKKRSNNLSPIIPPSFNISSDEGGSPAAAENGGADEADFNTPIRAEFQFLGRGGPPEEWATPPPATTTCGPETGAIPKG